MIIFKALLIFDTYCCWFQNCYNLFSQQIQLTKFLHPPKLSDIPDVVSIPTLNRLCCCMQNTILGNRNACLLTKQHLRKDLDYVHHLFACDIQIRHDTLVYFLTKGITATSSFALTLITNGYNGSFNVIKLLGKHKTNLKSNVGLVEVNPTEAPDVLENIERQFFKLINEEQWKLR